MTTLEAVDVSQARKFFDQTRKRVAEVTGGLSDAQWRFKPGPERWSIAENLEHMVIVQERVLGTVLPRLADGPAPAADRDHQRIDAIVIEKIPDRSIKAKAPDFLKPTG